MPAGRDLMISELVFLFWEHVKQHYRHPDGTPTTEVANFKYALRPLKQKYAFTMAEAFGPLALKAVRQSFVDAELARGEINRRISGIRHMFKWAVAEELVHSSVYHALQAVEGLKAGRCEAPRAGDSLGVVLRQPKSLEVLSIVFGEFAKELVQPFLNRVSALFHSPSAVVGNTASSERNRICFCTSTTMLACDQSVAAFVSAGIPRRVFISRSTI